MVLLIFAKHYLLYPSCFRTSLTILILPIRIRELGFPRAYGSVFVSAAKEQKPVLCMSTTLQCKAQHFLFVLSYIYAFACALELSYMAVYCFSFYIDQSLC
ncbi:hypothetical protein HPP92_013245 [Vanilla planifolia]|uniref:Uncharacterized protein n=1 Tax=Vanilla planifolia TaxID=51239 RepID=A0A835V0F7_VANPL|nr:hypothetical protein HPP92_013245 [Vanilla planifolia]